MQGACGQTSCWSAWRREKRTGTEGDDEAAPSRNVLQLLLPLLGPLPDPADGGVEQGTLHDSGAASPAPVDEAAEGEEVRLPTRWPSLLQTFSAAGRTIEQAAPCLEVQGSAAAAAQLSAGFHIDTDILVGCLMVRACPGLVHGSAQACSCPTSRLGARAGPFLSRRGGRLPGLRQHGARPGARLRGRRRRRRQPARPGGRAGRAPGRRRAGAGARRGGRAAGARDVPARRAPAALMNVKLSGFSPALSPTAQAGCRAQPRMLLLCSGGPLALSISSARRVAAPGAGRAAPGGAAPGGRPARRRIAGAPRGRPQPCRGRPGRAARRSPPARVRGQPGPAAPGGAGARRGRGLRGPDPS